MDVKFDNVAKEFGSSVVVDGLTLQIEDGEFVVLLGPSGCGKTTSLRMLAGLEEVTSGDIFIGRERVNDIPAQHRDVAMVFQSYALYPHMTVAENISYPLRVRRMEREEIRLRVERVAGMLEIGALLERRPRDLSGGERQRVALARAVVREPKAYLMDEPLSNLDAKLRVAMRGELKRLQHELGTTTVYVTHDQAEAMTLAHRVAVMRRGRLQQFDTPMNIYNLPANRFVAEFVGNPGMNFIEGSVDQAARRFQGSHLSLELSEAQLDRLKNQTHVTLGLRPEHVEISSVEREGWPQAIVYVTELMGNETLVFLRLGQEKIIARAPADFRAEPESSVWMRFEPNRMDFFDPDSGEALR
jgi:multiple sugar transport system ATP-binding protein